MPSRRLPTAYEFESQLFHQGPRYLVASFAQPQPERETELGDTARWFSVAELLRASGIDASTLPDAGQQWSALLDHCARALKDERDTIEAQAFVVALNRLGE